jgi:manganese/zinc/iron transport system permease protein
MVALLIIPGSAARFWTERLSVMLLIAGGIGLVSAAGGTTISAIVPRQPAGPTIVLVAAACFLFSMLFAPKRGLVADLVRRWQIRRRYGMQNLLRVVYEHCEPRGDFTLPISAVELLPRSAWTDRALRKQFRRALAAGLLEPRRDRFRLTRLGHQEAVKVVRAHRLWETFLLQEGDVAAEFVHRDADEIEHVLAPEVLAQLEQHLRDGGRLPGTAYPPAPAHKELVS